MMTCLQCKVRYEDESRFCARCGGPLVSEVAAGPEFVGRPAESLGLLEDALRSRPGDLELLKQRCELLQGLEPADPSRLGAALQALLERDRGALPQWERFADTLAGTGRARELLEACHSLLMVVPLHARAHLLIGVAAHDRGDDAGALTHLEVALQHPGGLPDAVGQVARLLVAHARLRSGRKGPELVRAIRDLDLRDLPGSRRPLAAECLLAAAHSLRAEEPLGEAVESCLEQSLRLVDAPEVRDELAGLLAARSREHLSAGRFAGAEAAARRLLEVAPGNKAAREVLSRIGARGHGRMLAGAAAVVAVAGLAAAAWFLYGGHVRVSVPANVTVRLEEANGGIVPWASTTGPWTTGRLAPGTYLLRARSPRHLAYDTTVLVRPLATLALQPALVRGFAHWKVSTTPRAQLLIDGRDVGRTPLEIPRFPMGPHEFEFRAPGRPALRQTLEAQPGIDRVVRIDLSKPFDGPAGEDIARPVPGEVSLVSPGYFVIGFTARDMGQAVAESRRHSGARGLGSRVLYSSDWAGLVPGWYVVVYGSYSTNSEAAQALQDVQRVVPGAYIKHSGNRR